MTYYGDPMQNIIDDISARLDEAYRAVLYQDDFLAGESGGWTEEQYEERWALIDRVVSAASEARE